MTEPRAATAISGTLNDRNVFIPSRPPHPHHKQARVKREERATSWGL